MNSVLTMVAGLGLFLFAMQLVEQAVGFDAARGDRISVINQSFQSLKELLAA